MTETTNSRIDPVDVPGRLAALHAAHVKTYNSVSDEVWGTNPVCAEDGRAWPCDVAETFRLVGEEVAHRVNPVIGWLRLVESDLRDQHQGGTVGDYRKNRELLMNAVSRLRVAVNFFIDPEAE